MTMAKIKYRSGSGFIEILDTTAMGNRIASIESKVSSLEAKDKWTLLWSGTKTGSGSLSVNGIGGYGELGLLVDGSGTSLQSCMVLNGKVDLSCVVSYGDYKTANIDIEATVASNSINITSSHVGIVGANSWGGSVVTIGGDAATISAIYGRR